jgi:hypothetical protein
LIYYQYISRLTIYEFLSNTFILMLFITRDTNHFFTLIDPNTKKMWITDKQKILKKWKRKIRIRRYKTRINWIDIFPTFTKKVYTLVKKKNVYANFYYSEWKILQMNYIIHFTNLHSTGLKIKSYAC